MTRASGGFVGLFVRDLVLVAVSAGLLALEARLSGPASLAVGIVAGVALAGAGFLVHEWGHWLGARAAGGIVYPARSLGSFFLFSFDTAESTPRQFLSMSVGGYVATVVAVTALALIVDLGRTSGVTAVTLSVLGLLVTFALEIPTAVHVYRGGAMPTGGVYASGPPAAG